MFTRFWSECRVCWEMQKISSWSLKSVSLLAMTKVRQAGTGRSPLQRLLSCVPVLLPSSCGARRRMSYLQMTGVLVACRRMLLHVHHSLIGSVHLVSSCLILSHRYPVLHGPHSVCSCNICGSVPKNPDYGRNTSSS